MAFTNSAGVRNYIKFLQGLYAKFGGITVVSIATTATVGTVTYKVSAHPPISATTHIDVFAVPGPTIGTGLVFLALGACVAAFRYFRKRDGFASAGI